MLIGIRQMQALPMVCYTSAAAAANIEVVKLQIDDINFSYQLF